MKLSAIVVLIGAAMTTAAASGQSLPNLFPLPNRSGFVETYNVHNAPISLKGAFFQSLGTNGRSCSSCHLPTEGWSISAEEVQLRFLLTQGLDPIFRTNDGSNCDQNIDTSTVRARKAYVPRQLVRIACPYLTVPSLAIASTNPWMQ
jgi:hypothetical protein